MCNKLAYKQIFRGLPNGMVLGFVPDWFIVPFWLVGGCSLLFVFLVSECVP